MGKNHLINHRAAFDDDDTARHKQPAGCVWGLFRVLNYHHWQHNPKTVIGQTDPKRDSFQKMSSHDEVEIEKLLGEMDPNLILNKTRRRTRRKKKPLRMRIKALIVKEGSSSRTYSIHRLENLRNRLAKFRKSLNKAIGFLGKNTEIETKMKPDAYTPCNNEPAHKPDDVLEIFKVDKDLLVEHLQDADESLANFSRSALRLGLNPNAIFGKSRSFPMHQVPQRRMKFKPTKLENKKIEVWSYLKGDKLQAVNKGCDYTIRRYHRRSLSSTESLDKYAMLYEKSYVNDFKLQHSKSLRVGKSESDISVPAHFRRLSSTSNIDSYDLFEVPRDEHSGTTTVRETNSVLEYMKQGEDNTVMGRGDKSKMDVNEAIDVITERVRTTRENEDVENVKSIDVESDKTVQSNLAFELEEVNASDKEVHDHSSALKCNNPNDTEPGIEMDNEALITKIYSSDSNYIRHLLDRSCIALNASERAWHAYDQPLSPQLLEEEHSSNCSHRQMLFDYVNEKLVEIYDMSLPYYPKPLSLNCHVLTFPRGNRIVDEVLKRVGSLLDLSSGEEQSSLDRIVAGDFAKDRNWMNLQIEGEMKALEIEDTIFEELVEEIIYFLKFN